MERTFGSFRRPDIRVGSQAWLPTTYRTEPPSSPAAAPGIGKATAELLAANGAAVLVARPYRPCIHRGRGDHGCGGSGGGVHRRRDRPGSVRGDGRRSRRVGARYGSRSTTPASAGKSALIGDYGLDSWRRVIDVNLNSVFYCMQAELPAIAAAGGGSIVNMASILGSVGFAMSSAYVTAKHGLLGLTRTGRWSMRHRTSGSTRSAPASS